MPTSKKRVKKDYEEAIPVNSNPLKSKWGKIMILILVLGFVLSGVIGLIYTLVKTLETM